MKAVFVCSLIFWFIQFGLQAQELSFRSGPKQVALLELYTSKGCSSCPPAETWIGQLAESEQLWAEVVPVAFHVDYWDNLGWPDPYAKSEFTQRQRSYAGELRMRTIYTPGFFLNGTEWRWRAGVESFGSNAKPGVLEVSLVGDKVQIDASDIEGARELSVALLSSGVTNSVARGENRGRSLSTHFSIIDYHEGQLGSDGIGEVKVSLPEVGAGERLAIAVWVSADTKQAPLQASGAWIE